MPLQASWQIRRGDTWRSRRYAVVIDGAPVDLDDPGWSVRAQIRTRDGALLETLHVLLDSATVQLTDPDNGDPIGSPFTTATVQVALTATETAELAGGGRADVELRHLDADTIDDSDWVITIVEADVTIDGDVSR